MRRLTALPTASHFPVFLLLRQALRPLGRGLAAVLIAAVSTQTLAAEQEASTDEEALVATLAQQFAEGQIGGSILFWNDRERRVGFKNLDRIYPTRSLPASTSPFPLGERPRDLGDLTYTVDAERFTLADFLAHESNVGMIVVQDGDVVLEHYARGNDATTPWVSFSVTKSVTSMLIGAAIRDGFIESVDEPAVHYLPRLRGTAYEGASIEDVLQMSSGVAWNEDYADPESDVALAGGLNGLELQRYDETLQGWEENAVKSQTSMSLLNFGQGAIIAIGVTLIMIFAANGVVTGNMSIGDLVLVNAFMLQLFIPLGFLGIVYRQIKYSLADMDLIFKLLESEPEITDAPNARPLSLTSGEVRFEQVNFSYQPEREILHGIDFSVRPGEKVAVVGHSGAGKSTLSRLLFRFYDVTAGRVLLDGQDLRQVTRDSLRRVIGIVPQDTVLFNDSILYNLAYGRPQASREEIEAAARMAHIAEFIESLPDGYDTVVGERGLKLSGGEKQRIAIARAMLKRPRILVFDEATSSLDSKTEQAIQETLKEVARDHTTLVIAHRLSTVVDADRILVMDQGRIREQGTHKALLEQAGVYAQMWLLQQQEERA